MTQDLAALVAELRHVDKYEPIGLDGWVAADALEAQAAEIARLTAERDAYARHLNDERENYAEQIGRAEKAEAALAETNRVAIAKVAEATEARMKAEAERDQWAAREGAAANTIINLNAELLTAHQALSESQALLAMWPEVAAKIAHEGTLATEDDGIAAWIRDRIRALTPAAAQATLDARINAAKEEGRIMGLREAAKLIDEGFDRGIAPKVEQCAHDRYGWEDCESCASAAILAKIKEANHE